MISIPMPEHEANAARGRQARELGALVASLETVDAAPRPDIAFVRVLRGLIFAIGSFDLAHMPDADGHRLIALFEARRAHLANAFPQIPAKTLADGLACATQLAALIGLPSEDLKRVDMPMLVERAGFVSVLANALETETIIRDRDPKRTGLVLYPVALHATVH